MCAKRAAGTEREEEEEEKVCILHAGPGLPPTLREVALEGEKASVWGQAVFVLRPTRPGPGARGERDLERAEG